MIRTTILLAEDHMVVRQGFRRLLELESDLEVVGEAEDGRQAVAMAIKLRPAVVLMDIAMPQLNGLEATRQVLKALPATKVLILSAHSDEAYFQNATASGAVGFLLKQSSAHEVARAIRTVLTGVPYTGPAPTDRDRRSASASSARLGVRRKPTIALTSREMEVLQLIAEGKANKQVAGALGITMKTVEKHRAHLMDKLDIHNTAGLTRYAISTGIIESHVPLTIL